METFGKFFSGTAGVILAIAFCGVCLLAAGIIACVVSSGAIIAISTPMP